MVFEDRGEQERLTELPQLAVEILSTDRARDIIRKARKYAAAGLPRHWIVDPGEPGEATPGGLPELIESRTVEGIFVEQGRYRQGGTITLDLAPDVFVSFDPAIFLD